MSDWTNPKCEARADNLREATERDYAAECKTRRVILHPVGTPMHTADVRGLYWLKGANRGR